MSQANAVGWERRAVLRTIGLGAAGAGVGGLGLLSACSSDTKDATATSSTTAPSTTSTSAAAPAVSFDPDKPYWEQGNFRPVTTEETVTELTVKGKLPSSLSGLFVRNGSNPPSGTSAHWFLGDGMVHGVRLSDGKAQWYRNRYVSTTVHKAGGDLTTAGIPQNENNQSNVALVHHAGKLLSTGEVGWPYELNPSDLSTVGAHSFGGKLGPTMTAHPKIDPVTGRMHFFGYEFLRPALTYYAAAPDGTLDVVSPIAVDKATMIHDFAITDKDAIFWIGPVMFGADESNPNPAVPFHWDPNGPCRVGVMPLDGSGDEIRWVDIDPCFVFHSVNAHRDGDDVVVNLSRLEQAFGPKGDLVDSFPTEWRINTAGANLAFSEKQVSDRPMDLPSHDRRFTGRETNQGWYATVTSQDSDYGFELEGICRLDLRTGKEDVWPPGKNRRSGEGFFVPDGDNEGEGWVITYIWDRTTDTSSLGVFDAMAMADGPVAEVPLPVRVPFGFHGLWVPEEDL